MHTYTHIYIHTDMHTYIHTCIHTYTHIHTCTHTYIHTYICDLDSASSSSSSSSSAEHRRSCRIRSGIRSVRSCRIQSQQQQQQQQQRGQRKKGSRTVWIELGEVNLGAEELLPRRMRPSTGENGFVASLSRPSTLPKILTSCGIILAGKFSYADRFSLEA
jgi:hypothetical protein